MSALTQKVSVLQLHCLGGPSSCHLGESLHLSKDSAILDLGAIAVIFLWASLPVSQLVKSRSWFNSEVDM